MLDFETAYPEKASYVYELCYRAEGDREKAERLFAEVWRTAHESFAEEPVSHGDIAPLLCGILARSQRRLGARSDQDAPLLEPALGSPEHALLRLAPEYRLPLLFREVGGLNYTDIATALEIPEATVRARLGRARGLIRDACGRAIQTGEL